MHDFAAAFLTKYNSSIRTGQFPDAWRKVLVKPILKSGSPHEISNNRPISLLPVTSKVLEKIIPEQLLTYLENKNLLHLLQFGFRQNYLTETLLLEQVKQSVDKGLNVGAVFLDVKLAFDTMNHDLLISKLSLYDFSE